MRARDDFTVFPRVVRSGKTIWYYQTYDEDGRRTVAKSTGESTKTAATKKCNELMRDGRLLASQQSRIPTFAEYAKGWWEPETCKYLKKRNARKPLTPDYAEIAKSRMELYLIPYFGKMRLDRITEEDIETWLVNFCEREQRHNKKNANDTNAPVAANAEVATKNLKPGTANFVFAVLRVMLKEAVKRRLITFSPADSVEKLAVEPKKVEILTMTEFKELVKPEPKAIPLEINAGPDVNAFNMELAKMANFLAACTGMRIGEVLGLRGDCVFADYIRVQGQFGRRGYGPTKTRTTRNIPLIPVVMDGLRRLVATNGSGFLFSADGGNKPIKRYWFKKYLTVALAKIGIDKTEKKRRNLTPHAWRHFLNTHLRACGVADAKVQSITGHKSQSMTERYTQFYTEEFSEVRKIQDTLMLADIPETGSSPNNGGATAVETM